MIKWTGLQMNLMPVIAVQTDHAIQKLHELMQKVSKQAHPQDIEALNQLRKSILKRIECLDRFYEQKHNFQNIDIFHMMKLKLQRAIFKLGYIQNETLSSDMINQMFERDSINQYGESRVRSGSPNGRPHTYNGSQEHNSFSHHREPLWMETGNTSFDFDPHHDQPLFRSPQKMKSKEQMSKSPLQKNKTHTAFNKDKSAVELKRVNTNKPTPSPTPTPTNKANQNRAPPQTMTKQHPSSTTAINKKPSVANSKTMGQAIHKLATSKQKNQKSTTTIRTAQKMTKSREKAHNFKQPQQTAKNRTHREKQILIEEPMEAVDASQFRFTIKMTKEEYKKLQALKDQMVRQGKLPQ